jgi:hypothetical protein
MNLEQAFLRRTLLITLGICATLAIAIGGAFYLFQRVALSPIIELNAAAPIDPSLTPAQYEKQLAVWREQRVRYAEAVDILEKNGALFFKQLYSPMVLFWFGCSIGVVIGAWWPLIAWLRQLAQRMAHATLAVVAAVIAGAGVGQGIGAYRALASLQTVSGADHLYGVVLGAAVGGGAGLLVGTAAAGVTAALVRKGALEKLDY